MILSGLSMSIPGPFDFLTFRDALARGMVSGLPPGPPGPFPYLQLFLRRLFFHHGNFAQKGLPFSPRTVVEIKNARILSDAGVLLECSAPSGAASSPAGASASQGLGRHGADGSDLERHGAFLEVGCAHQPFRFRAAALRTGRAGCVWARHVFKFVGTRGTVKIVHGHEDLSIG